MIISYRRSIYFEWLSRTQQMGCTIRWTKAYIWAKHKAHCFDYYYRPKMILLWWQPRNCKLNTCCWEIRIPMFYMVIFIMQKVNLTHNSRGYKSQWHCFMVIKNPLRQHRSVVESWHHGYKCRPNKWHVELIDCTAGLKL